MDSFERLLVESNLTKEKLGQQLYDSLKRRYNILLFIKSLEGIDKISHVSLTAIAEKFKISRSRMEQIYKQLHNTDNMIKKVGKCQYRVNKTNVLKYGIMNRIIRFMALKNLISNFCDLNWKEQADKLKITYKEIQEIYAWINLKF